MTSDRAIEMQANGLPNTFVPGRNLLFLTLAAALGYRRAAGGAGPGPGQPRHHRDPAHVDRQIGDLGACPDAGRRRAG
ncbi:hypothetical protein G6F62_015718 [Rhizopus arrhizus]|nr:hypothetical protein G6F62_015718 [Rhizopus arrhizus]